MVVKNKCLGASAAAFGVALSTMYSAPDLQADIVSINFSPASVGPGNSLLTVTMAGVGLFAQMSVDNSTFFGKNFYGLSNLYYLQSVQQSDTINPFDLKDVDFNSSYGASGIRFVGFQTYGGNVGWFKVDLGAPSGGTIQFLEGQFGNAGESVHVGGAVPEPSGAIGLALLALGSAGVRRRRDHDTSTAV